MIIGLAGPAGSGKDTVADWLEAGHDFTRFALADPIRKGLCAMFGLPMTVFKPGVKEQVIPWLGKSPRQLKQPLSTEKRQKLVAPPNWLRVSEHVVATEPGANIVVTDIRMAIEVEWLRRLGGQLWHVRRPGCAPVRGHSTEDGLPAASGDILVSNCSTLAELYASVDLIINRSMSYTVAAR